MNHNYLMINHVNKVILSMKYVKTLVFYWCYCSMIPPIKRCRQIFIRNFSQRQIRIVTVWYRIVFRRVETKMLFFKLLRRQIREYCWSVSSAALFWFLQKLNFFHVVFVDFEPFEVLVDIFISFVEFDDKRFESMSTLKSSQFPLALWNKKVLIFSHRALYCL